MSDSAATIAQELVTLCQQGRNDEVIDKYYSPDIVSIEAAAFEDQPAEIQGIEAVRGKNAWWTENNEVHSATVNGPFMHSNGQFAVEFEFETTFKPTGQRGKMSEMAVYAVKDGRIVRERFYYNPNG
jgi:ketosteroid isomerase-like protein